MSHRIETVRANLDRIGALEWVRKMCRRRASFEELVGTGRTQRVIELRHEVWALLHGTLALSHVEIARTFDVNHSTVYAALAKRERRAAESIA